MVKISIFWLFRQLFEIFVSPNPGKSFYTPRGGNTGKNLHQKNINPIWVLGDQFSRKNDFFPKTAISFDFLGVVIRNEIDCRRKIMGVYEA